MTLGGIDSTGPARPSPEYSCKEIRVFTKKHLCRKFASRTIKGSVNSFRTFLPAVAPQSRASSNIRTPWRSRLGFLYVPWITAARHTGYRLPVDRPPRPPYARTTGSEFSRSAALLVRARLCQFWRAGRADRHHAHRTGRASPLDQRKAFPARVELLHGAAWSGRPPKAAIPAQACR